MKKQVTPRLGLIMQIRTIFVAAILISLLLNFNVGLRAQELSPPESENRQPTPGEVKRIPLDFKPGGAENTAACNNLIPEACVNRIQDGSFEAGGIPSTIWDPETSTNFGTPLCDNASCGTGGGASPPRTGLIWAWFGGIPAPETASIGQTVIIPSGATATLNFWMRNGTVSSPFTDVLNVRVDGVIQQIFTEASVAEGSYTLRSINLNAFANGAPHQILFEYIGATTGTASFVVDDVSLDVCNTCVNQINDSSFEMGGIPSTFWDPETSTNFGTPLCNNANCGTGGGASPPRTGLIWAWFGGIPAPETASIGQTVVIPSGTTATLNFWMRNGTVSAPFTDVLNVRVDGVIQRTFTEAGAAESAYTLRSINLNAFANGVAHQILFEYIGTTTSTASFVIDDVSLDICSIATAANASISGRVLQQNGAGISKALVSLTDSSGQSRTILTNALGFYQFEDVQAGEIYIISVTSKQARFAPQAVQVNEDLTEINFTPLE